MVIDEKAQAVSRRSLEYARERGDIKGCKMRLALDSTPVLGRGAVEDTCNPIADDIEQPWRVVRVRGGLGEHDAIAPTVKGHRRQAISKDDFGSTWPRTECAAWTRTMP